jgi:hypothetical protein
MPVFCGEIGDPLERFSIPVHVSLAALFAQSKDHYNNSATTATTAIATATTTTTMTATTTTATTEIV